MKKRVLSLIMVMAMMLGTLAVSAGAKELYTPTATAKLNNHTYHMFDESMTWDEAKAYCEELEGHLVTITSEEEQKLVEALLEQGEKAHKHRNEQMLLARKLTDYRLDTHINSARRHYDSDIAAHNENICGNIDGLHKALHRRDENIPYSLRILFGRCVCAGYRLKLFSIGVDIFILACRDNPCEHCHESYYGKKSGVARWHL